MSIEGMIAPLEQPPGSIRPIAPLERQAEQKTPEGPGFAELLREQMDQLVKLQNTAEQAQQDLLAGKTTDISQVVLAVQQADLAMNFAIELRNKVVESYLEISRMQI